MNRILRRTRNRGEKEGKKRSSMSARNQTYSRSFLVCLLFSFSDGRLPQCPGLRMSACCSSDLAGSALEEQGLQSC